MFLVFYSGERAKNKILKICEAFGANRYSFDEDLGKQTQVIAEVRQIVRLILSLILISMMQLSVATIKVDVAIFSF